MSYNISTSEKKRELINSSSCFLNQKDESTSNKKNNINLNLKFNLSVSDKFAPGSVKKLSNSRIKNLSLIDSSIIKR